MANVDTNEVYDRLKSVIIEKMKEQGKTEQQFKEAWRSLYYTIPVTGFLERMCGLLHALRCTQEDILYIFEADKLPSRKEDDCR